MAIEFKHVPKNLEVRMAGPATSNSARPKTQFTAVDSALSNAKTLPEIRKCIDEASTGSIKKALNGAKGKADKVRKVLLERTLTVAKAGKGGISSDLTFQPRCQAGSTCQTEALLNGMGAYGRVSSLSVHELRMQAANPDAMLVIAEVLDRQGELKCIGLRGNPIRAARSLFEERGRFLGVLVADNHVRTILPIKNPSRQQFVIMLDSLGGRKEVWSQDQFLELLLSTERNDNFAAFAVPTIE